MKLSKVFFIAATLLVVSGCSNSTTEQSSIAEQDGETSSAVQISDQSSNDDRNSETSSAVQSSEQSSSSDGNSETLSTVQTSELPQNSSTVTSTGKIADFAGLGEQTFVPGNLTINAKICFCSEFLCAADGEAFFTNFADHEYLYKVTESGSELVIEKPAYHINYFDSKLYFLSSDSVSADNIDFVGTMYCYDLKTGACETLCDEEVHSLTVCAEGIYYSVLNAKESNGYSYQSRMMSFDGNSQNCFYDPAFRYGEYLVMPDKIVDMTKEENIAQPSYNDVIPFTEYEKMRGSCIYGENLFFFNVDNDLVILNLRDGTTLSVLKNKIGELVGDASASIGDYTVCGGKLYISDSSCKLVIVDLETAQATIKLVSECGGKIIDRLYTDGENIYALLRNYQYSAPEVVRLTENGSQYIAEKL